jgi:hypothetical protein
MSFVFKQTCGKIVGIPAAHRFKIAEKVVAYLGLLQRRGWGTPGMWRGC